MKHVIVTGGAGFIGHHLAATLLNRYPETRVTCIDNFDPFYSADLKQLNIRDLKQHPRFRFVYADIAFTAPDELAEMIGEPADAIVHIAAKAGVRPSILDPLAYQQANVIGLQNMLDFAVKYKISQFVFASSSSVYGVNDHYPWKEEEQLMPISPYAMTKLAGEMLGHVYSHLYDIRFIALRFFTVYGPAQRPDLAIHKFTRAMLRGEPITMYGDGGTSRDYTFVEDTVDGVIGALLYRGSRFEIINLGNNYSVSLKELISAIEKVTGIKAIIEQQPEQPGDVPKTFADISKARKLIGYNPQTSLEAGLAKFYDWFKENRELLLQ